MAYQNPARRWPAWLNALALFGVALALAVFVLGFELECDLPTLMALAAGATAAALLPVRLPGTASVSLLPAVLLPAWLACGAADAAGVAGVASLLGGAVRARALRPAALGPAAALVGVVSGDRLAVALAASGALGAWATERLVVGCVFMVAYWLGELATLRLGDWLGLAEGVRMLPRSSIVANVVLAFPGVVLADLLVSRGLQLFGPMLLLLLAALALIALYLGAEAARRDAASEGARLRSIVAHAPEGIFAVGPDLSLEWLNEPAARLTGWNPSAAIGELCSEVVQLRLADGTLADHQGAFALAARSGHAVHTPGVLQLREGRTTPVVVSYTAVADESGGMQVGVGALREAHAGAPSEADERAADLEHELRSPLSVILGYARMMASAPAGSLDAERQAEFIARISESGDYMLRLVNNLLDLRRLESGAQPLQLERLELEPFLRMALSMVRPRADDKQIDIAMDVEPDLPTLVTDELLVRRVVDNLLSNAVKYTPAGGSVRLTARREGEGVAVGVCDTGLGLTEEEQARLFERFFRSGRAEARRERGTGLGLALVREASRRLSGEVRVNSKVDKGSTFTLWLPLRHPDASS